MPRSRTPSAHWVIYTLVDPREPEVVRYVGWTDCQPRRLRDHVKHAKTGQDKTYCGNWKRTLLRAGFEPVMTVIESGTGDGWGQAEVRWIAHYRSLFGARLTNLTVGGEGAKGCVRSAQTRAKISAGNKGKIISEAQRAHHSRVLRGRPLSAEHRAALSLGQTGRKKPPDVVEKTAAFWRGRNHTDETKAKMREYHQGLSPAVPPKTPRRTEDSRAKTSAALKSHYAAKGGGRPISDEAKAKISTALIAYRARKKDGSDPETEVA